MKKIIFVLLITIICANKSFAIDKSKSVGTTASSLTVSPTGGATYSIVFDVPKGLGGMQPNVGLAYNSQGGIGIAGYGFNITGISVITRGCKSLHYDNFIKGISYEATDAYFLDGKRLIRYSGNEGQEGAVYNPEGDPYTKVTFHGTYDSSTANTWVEVLSKDGIRYEYGRMDNARQSYINKKNNPRINAWYISKQEDAQGNYINYTYIKNSLMVYPTKIEYGNNTKIYTGYIHSVNFTYGSLGNNSRSFVIEDQTGNLDKKLVSVSVKTNSSIYRTYKLDYNETGDQSTVKYSRLVKVTEANSNGEEKNPIYITWNYLTNYNQSARTLSVNVDESNPMIEKQDMGLLSVDLNGDGISDIIRISRVRVYTIKTSSQKQWSDKTYAYIHCSSVDNNGNVSFTGPLKLDLGAQFVWDGFKSYLGGSVSMDIDGDGLNDLLIPKLNVFDDINSKYVSYILVLGKDVKAQKSTSIFFNCPLKNTSDVPYYCTGDFNNDGKDDIFTIENKGNGNYYSAHVFYWDGNVKAGNTELSLYLSKAPKRIFSGDYNNDGLTDIIVFYDGGYKIFYNNASLNHIADFTTSKTLTGTTFGYNWRMEQGDFNGDGLSDFVYVPGLKADCYWALSNGDGTFTITQACVLDVFDKNTKKDDDKFSLLPYDIDHDGITDLVVVKPHYEYHGGLKNYYEFKYNGVRWYTSDRTKLVLQKSVNTTKSDDGLQSYITLGDFNGDGSMDLLNYGSDFWGNTSSEAKVRVYGTSSLFAGIGKINRITDGFGETQSITYSATSKPSVYSHTYDGTYPLVDCHTPFHVVNNTISTNGMAGSQTVSYTYKGLKINAKGKGLLGMQELCENNTTLGVKNITSIEQWDSNRFIPVKTCSKQIIGNDEAVTENNMTIYNSGNNYFAYPSYSECTDMDGNSVTTTSEYNTYNGCLQSQSVTYDKSMYVNTAYSGFVKVGNSYKPTLITKTQKHEDDNNEYTQRTHIAYLDNGLPKTITENYSTPMALTTSMTYDAIGNLISKSTLGKSVIPITQYMNYDASKRFVVKTYQSPAAAVNTFTYDVWGNILTSSDVTESSLPLTTTYEYDAWGNEKKRVLPAGEVVNTNLGWAVSGNLSSVRTSQTGQPTVEIWYDSKGRKVQMTTVAVKNATVKENMTYNNKGQVAKKISQTGNLTISDTYTYDGRGRVISAMSTSGKSLSYSYGNRSVTTTDGSKTYTKTFDAWGNIKTSTDPVASVEYTYASNGKPSEISSAGAIIRMEYDEAGNQTVLDDPDAGLTTYEYAADGTLLQQTDARGIITSNKYDTAGKLTSTTIGTDVITYQYGQSGSNKLRITKEQMGNNSVEYDYDRYGRLTSKKKTIDGKEQLEYHYVYNDKNQLKEIQYPGNLTVGYEYDTNGYKIASSVGNNPVYSLTDYNGLTTKTTHGKYLKGTVTRDSRGYLTAKNMDVGRTVYDMSFSYNGSTGNLISRTGMLDDKETFYYDNMDRLLRVHKDNANITTRVMSYSSNGNIRLNSNIGYSYYEDETKLHALTWHNLGQKAVKSEQQIDYNGFNKVQSIEDADSCFMTTFSYGPDMQRWSSDFSENGTLKRRIVYSDDYEQVTEDGVTRRLYYLDGGAVVIRQDGKADEYYYCCTDNLGSIVKVVTPYGNDVFTASYDVWGLQTVTKNTIGFLRGYCGHEMMPEYNLINMNGRMYDPVTCRFLSPDPYIQMPDNSQSFNRYSYCLNNPLKYTDPSGESFAAIFAFAVFNVASSMMQASMSGKNVWKAGALSLLSSAASFGIGEAFGNVGSVGKELLRAGAHGMAGGVISALNGGNFANAFVSGAAASGIGSYAQISDMKTGWMVVSTTAMGGVAAWATGGDFLQGALQGMAIGYLNHRQHDPENRGQLFHGKNARKRAYYYMKSRSAKKGYELSAVYLENGDVLVFKEKGNTQTSSNNYFIKQGGDILVSINGEKVRATGSLHTHPYAYGNLMPENPLGISAFDINKISVFFDYNIDVLIVEASNGIASGVYGVSTQGNGLMFPQLKFSF